MKLPQAIIRKLNAMADRTASRREPDFVIGNRNNPYLERWWIIPRNRFFNIYLHRFLKSDDDRALHDHPWINCSILINGEYVEHTIAAGGIQYRNHYVTGDIKFRRAKYAHRVELINGQCWTLFITGPVIREWGFHCVHGWRRWQEFVDQRDSGQIGRGCD